MKKCFLIFLIVFILFAANNVFAGSSAQRAPEDHKKTQAEAYELALVLGIGSVDDGSFNQGSWEGLLRFAVERNISHKYYQSAEENENAYLGAIDLAVSKGAKVIVTPGYLFETPVFTAQDKYPNVRFILIDSIPNNGDFRWGTPVYRTANNTVGVLFAEDQAGFLAGYAAVMDGYRKLGFIGGMAASSVVRFGNGFVQGAEYAAQELRLSPGTVTVNYHYTGDFSASAQAQSLAVSWYTDGVEVIFACGGAVGSSIIAAAERTGGKVIGVDIDQSGDSSTVITSAIKMLQTSVYDSIASYYKGTFPGGETLIFHAANNGIGLPMPTSRFRTFSSADYIDIYRLLANGTIPRIERVDARKVNVPVSAVRILEM